jgi:hypothetical protein
LTSKNAEFEMYGRVHGDLFNVPLVFLRGVQLEIKSTKSKSDFNVLSSMSNSSAFFKFLDATLRLRHVTPSPTILLNHTRALEKVNPRYDVSRVSLTTFTYRAGYILVSIDNAVLGTLPKRLPFTMLRSTDYKGSAYTKPYFFKHFPLNHVVMYVSVR